MAHGGYEPTAASAALSNPFKAAWVALRGVRTTGPMAPEINLDNQRPAQYIFSAEVQKRLSDIRRDEAAAAAAKHQQKGSKAARGWIRPSSLSRERLGRSNPVFSILKTGLLRGLISGGAMRRLRRRSPALLR